MAKKRINVYVDGFNLYHSALQKTYPECRWLNLFELSKRLINPKTEEIQTVYITLLADAVMDKFDTALILSGDSDLAPVSGKLRLLCPGKKIGIAIPKGQLAVHLKQHADFHKTTQAKDFKHSLLPEQVTYNGNIKTAPAGWLPKPKSTL